jgi:DNA-binding NtrC family response regulator
VGGTKNIEVDVRIISATNKDLSQFIKDKQFREDLIYRLNTISIHLPPLRERPNDIPLLANHFLNQHAKQKNQILEFSANCLDVLLSYHWPGNVRELKGVVDYAVTMATGSLITDNYLPDFLLPPERRKDDKTQTETHQPKADQVLGLLSTAVQHAERKIIREVLQQAKNRSEAIKILGISRRTFYSKLKQYNLD